MLIAPDGRRQIQQDGEPRPRTHDKHTRSGQARSGPIRRYLIPATMPERSSAGPSYPQAHSAAGNRDNAPRPQHHARRITGSIIAYNPTNYENRQIRVSASLPS